MDRFLPKKRPLLNAQQMMMQGGSHHPHHLANQMINSNFSSANSNLGSNSLLMSNFAPKIDPRLLMMGSHSEGIANKDSEHLS